MPHNKDLFREELRRSMARAERVEQKRRHDHRREDDRERMGMLGREIALRDPDGNVIR